MLSENAIDSLVQPIVARQQKINEYVIEIICKRVKEIGHLLPSDLHRLERLLKMGGDVKKINEEIARQTGLQVKDIKELIKEVALDGYIDAKPYYDYRHKEFIPFLKNVPLQNIVNAVATQTAQEYVNMAKAQAFMIRDLKNPKNLIPTSISKTYYSVIDEAVQAVQSGVIDYNTAMRRTIKQLADSGLRRVEYNPESGRRYTQRMDTAVRRNILDAVRAVNQGVQDEVGKQFGADGKEITVHANPAADHAAVQGHQFSNEQYDILQSDENKSFKDVDGNEYQHFDRHIGTLNCRHFTHSIIIGFSNPNYTDAQLKKILQDNEKGYTLPNGKHLTMYECTQKQRQMETAVRYAKDGQIAARAAGDEVLAKKYQAEINELTNKYNAFSKACGLSPKPVKMRVAGYRKISTK